MYYSTRTSVLFYCFLFDELVLKISLEKIRYLLNLLLSSMISRYIDGFLYIHISRLRRHVVFIQIVYIITNPMCLVSNNRENIRCAHNQFCLVRERETNREICFKVIHVLKLTFTYFVERRKFIFFACIHFPKKSFKIHLKFYFKILLFSLKFYKYIFYSFYFFLGKLFDLVSKMKYYQI